MEEKQLLIYVVDDDPASGHVIAEMVASGYPTATVKEYTDHVKFLEDPDICEADLFVIDICLANFDGRALPARMPTRCKAKPFLFVSGFTISDAEFEGLENVIHFDFVRKPFQLRHFIHRLGVMLQMRPAIVHRLQADLFDLLIYSPFVALVTDEFFRVQYCNRQTADLLGLSTTADIVGRSWLDFIPHDVRDTIVDVHSGLMDGKVQHFGEFTNEVMRADGQRQLVKWFNSPFEGEGGQQLALSIGVAGEAAPGAVSRIRQKFLERIMNDRANIRAARRFEFLPMEDFTCRLPT